MIHKPPSEAENGVMPLAFAISYCTYPENCAQYLEGRCPSNTSFRNHKNVVLRNYYNTAWTLSHRLKTTNRSPNLMATTHHQAKLQNDCRLRSQR
eukprot:2839374-Pleurochrysis_carterae.AAC.1